MDPRGRRSWQPVLDGEAARDAERVIDAIAGALARAPVASPGIVDGAAGRALVLHYLDRGDGAQEELDRAIDLLAEQPVDVGLFTGFPGVAWVVEHLTGDDDDDDPCADLDEPVREALVAGASPEHDLVSGVAGLGVYAIERSRRQAGAEVLALVVDRLAALAVEHSDGIAWHTAAARLDHGFRGEYPDGCDDMGVAHGTPGAMAVLAAASAAGVDGARARSLFDRAWTWMMAHRLPAARGAVFPYWRGTGPARSAWCYGDPGVARTLFVAARAIGDDDRAAVAAEIARRSYQRPRAETGCGEAGLCHGAAGLAHLANRMWQETGDDAFAEAARRWYGEAMTMARTGDLTVLDGEAGIALVLAAAITTIEPAWDRLLLASVPPVD